MKISLGPIQYFWSKDEVYRFYDSIVDSPVDIVYLGENICSKRRNLKTSDWINLAREITAGGKKVILSTLALIEAESELKTLRRICQQQEFMVEANDMGAVQLLSEQGIPFVTGPFINIYNARTLAFLVKQGLRRWVMPVELSAKHLSQMLRTLSTLGVTDMPETEILSYGHMPLALSARCFTARAHGMAKDDCQFVCGEFPTGLRLETQEGQQIFNINGIQTQSGHLFNLISDIQGLNDGCVDVLRLSPTDKSMSDVIRQFHEVVQGGAVPALAADSCNGYWHGLEGMKKVAGEASLP